MLRMKNIFFTLSLILICLSPCANAGGTGQEKFLSALQDIPLMPGMTEMKEEALVFDKPSGRIAESAALAQGIEVEEISRFYNLTLPQLGWLKTGEGAYVRQDEELRISVASAEGCILVRFMLIPR